MAIKLRSMITDKPDRDGTYMVTEKDTGRIAFFEYKKGSHHQGWDYCESFKKVKIIDTFWLDFSEVESQAYKFNTINVPGSWKSEQLKEEIYKASYEHGWSTSKKVDMNYWKEQIEQAQRQPCMSSNKINFMCNFYDKFKALDLGFKSSELTQDQAWALEELFNTINDINGVLDLDLRDFTTGDEKDS